MYKLKFEFELYFNMCTHIDTIKEDIYFSIHVYTYWHHEETGFGVGGGGVEWEGWRSSRIYINKIN